MFAYTIQNGVWFSKQKWIKGNKVFSLLQNILYDKADNIRLFNYYFNKLPNV